MKKVENFKVYCDGACEPNPGTGGYCSVIFKAEDISPRVIISGGFKNTTNNRMEIMGVLCALEYIKEASNIIIFTDSKYVSNSINIWLVRWIKNHKKMKNMDLWNKIWVLKKKHHIKAVWIKGHNGNFYNEFADSISTEVIYRVNKSKYGKYKNINILIK